MGGGRNHAAFTETPGAVAARFTEQVLNDFFDNNNASEDYSIPYLMLLPDAAAVIRSYHLRQTGMKTIQLKQGLTALFIIIYSPDLMFLAWDLLKYLALIRRA